MKITKERLQIVPLPRKIKGNTHMRVLRPRMRFELGDGVHFSADADFREVLAVFDGDQEFLSALH